MDLDAVALINIDSADRVRSSKDSLRTVTGSGEFEKSGGIMPPTCLNHCQATVIDTPTAAAASATTIPARTAAQNSR
ncbi:hypothetical protein [Mangrovihabitans endophyticus]|uniref:Uncharacterized protein n=1 Tax=Mangrovihabitans endophyticus TaxID=1751298 RepID=A0A8J3FSE9_9ACTN|nr:hypothetical protein [Mangrovihabitans endophyticus]GGL19044.1 hypothetical protein GCM10012284_62000 [Mangrovihabitans endophyticus]